MKIQKVTVPVFDYDRTLCSDNEIPSKRSFHNLVKSLRDNLGIPLIIITAGSVNSIDDDVKNDYDGVDRPLRLSRDCNLRVIINDFNINADVCIYGQYMCDPKRRNFDKELINGNYVRGSVTSHRPVSIIGDNSYHILAASGEKKISVLYHILLSHGIDSEILFVDDMYYHDMSGLEGLVLDPFECAESSYFLIKPLKSKIDERINALTKSLYDGSIKKVLENMSVSVWRRFKY